jgi:peptidoglycan/xylan/chitin deacetylase (PgdA/CDA1 family)
VNRRRLKFALARAGTTGAAKGATLFIYHRVGGGSPDERDLATEDFAAQLEVLADHRLVSLDSALDDLDTGSAAPSCVVTFDDGFRDVYENAWPMLLERGVPFTLYLCTGFVGGSMHWDGSTAKAAGPALTWPQLEEMVGSGLCTIGNHSHTHARPERLTEQELDECSDLIEARLGVRPAHFAFTWGVPVPRMAAALRTRFRSACTGELGRNLPADDRFLLRRVPVRGSDPLPFFRAKLGGGLGPERAYARLVGLAKKAGVRA